MPAFWQYTVFADNPNDMRAIPPEMIRQRQISEYALAMQYKPTLADMSALANYRPQALVPKGWAEWSAYGTTY